MIRGELQRHMDKNDMTQAAMIRLLSVNNNSFRKFMNPGTYKNMWSATENGTYWAAAKFLEEERSRPKPKKTATKRKEAPAGTSTSGAPSTKCAKVAMEELMLRINAYKEIAVTEERVYDSCPEVVCKIKAFVSEPGNNKTLFSTYALGNSNISSLNKFLALKKQDGAGMAVYRLAWVFFEKKRVMEGKPKSKQRLKNEQEHPYGFMLEKESARKMWYYTADF